MKYHSIILLIFASAAFSSVADDVKSLRALAKFCGDRPDSPKVSGGGQVSVGFPEMVALGYERLDDWAEFAAFRKRSKDGERYSLILLPAQTTGPTYFSPSEWREFQAALSGEGKYTHPDAAKVATDLAGNVRFRGIGGDPLVRFDYSPVFRKHGVASLTHTSAIEEILGIVSSGTLRVPPIEDPYNPPKFTGRTFFHAVNTETPPKADDSWAWTGEMKVLSRGPDGQVVGGNTKRVYLVFSTDALNDFPFHLGAGRMKYSEFDPNRDFRSDQGTEALDSFLRRDNIGEVVVYDSVSLQKLKAIWVHPNERGPLLARLHSRGVFELNGRPVEDYFVSPAPAK